MQLEIRRAEDPPEGTLIFPAEGEPRDLVAGIAIRTMERGAFDGKRVGAEAIGGYRGKTYPGSQTEPGHPTYAIQDSV